MNLVGQTLKGRRERLGMTLNELETRTQIKRETLTLIENNDFESLKNVNYAEGFIRKYAKAVNIDSVQLIEAHREEIPSNDESLQNAITAFSKEDKPTSIKHDKPKNSTSQSTSNYESKYRLLPSDFNPKAAKGQSTMKNSGKYKVGKDIQPGHYTITHNNDKIGILEVDNEYGNYVFSNALSAKSETIAGKITTYLADGQTVVVKDMKHVKFTPEPIKYRTNLNTGVWVVGADIAPGSYTVRPGNKYSANFNVQSSKGESKAIEIIGDDSSNAKKSLHIDLKKDDVVLVQGSGTVKLGK